MGDQAMPDGQRRGGFARLAAVVKAERAKAGGHVIFAHAGDTLSPSLMSGLDHGAHIMTLTNMIPPDIFAPGNHEFDFGKETFFQRMAEAKFPLYAANLRDAGRQAAAEFQRPRDRDGRRRAHRAHRRDPRRDAAHVEPGATCNSCRRSRPPTQQAEALRREGADFVVAVVHADRKQDYEMFATRTVDLILTGHDHDLFINYDGRNAMVESSYDAHYVTAIDVTIAVKEQDGRRVDDLVAAVPGDRHRDGHARSRSGGGGREVSRRSWPARWTPRSAPPRSSSTAATPPCARARPRSAT